VLNNNKIFSSLAQLFLVIIFTLTVGGLALVEVISLDKMNKKNGSLIVGTTGQKNSSDILLIGVKQAEEISQVTEVVLADDARPVTLKRYLEKYKSPLAPYSDLIYELSLQYGYEYYWIPAIAQQESNLCKVIPADSHNCWGYGIHAKGTLKFDNYELAIKSFAEYLKREYFDKGYRTTEEIMSKYCPNSNGSWAFGVNQFIGDMESGVF